VCYDPLERAVATLRPDHTWEKVVFDPWQEVTWDVNDTVLIENPTDDLDVGGFFAGLDTADYLPTWYQAREAGQLGAAEQAAQRPQHRRYRAPGHGRDPTRAEP